ncbi:MAG: hypothetical protein O7D32_10145 [bacterium]|nr:hypothetical protein [bacterium]
MKIATAALLLLVATAASADDERPFVPGGIYDKPFILQVGEGAKFGGYADAQYRYERADGFVSEQSFILERINLFAFAALSERVRLAAELEFEDGGEEVKIELAIVDFEIHQRLTFRAGILLSPLGRFNLTHDSPAQYLVDRPLVSTRLIPTTFSEPGMGFLGAFYPTTNSRVTYEAYLVNGLDDGILSDRTFIPGGKSNFEDNNNHPSFVGRLEVSPFPSGEIAVSAHTGPYNEWEEEGVKIDERRDVTIVTIDGEYRFRSLAFLGEYARDFVDIPEGFVGLFAEKQQGIYLEGRVDFLRGLFKEMPNSFFAGAVRYDYVDFDTDREGDDHTRLTLGLGFRPVPATVFKLDYHYNWLNDRFNIAGREAGVVFGVATYF